MRAIVFGILCAALVPRAVLAAEPIGEWLVKDKTAHIRIADCGAALWGVVSWEAHAGTDDKNPDSSKRGRPTLGMPVLIGLKAGGPKSWDGAIYNSENGKTYSGGVTLIGEDRLRVRGCVLGFLCGGENWTRVEARSDSAALSDADICSGVEGTR